MTTSLGSGFIFKNKINPEKTIPCSLGIFLGPLPWHPHPYPPGLWIMPFANIKSPPYIEIGFHFWKVRNDLSRSKRIIHWGFFFSHGTKSLSWSVCSLLSEVISLEGQIEKLESHQDLDSDQGVNMEVSWRLGKKMGRLWGLCNLFPHHLLFNMS